MVRGERDADAEHVAPTLAEKMNRLFATVHPPGRGEYTLDEVAEAIGADGKVTMSAAYLSQMRKGQRTNPSKNVLEALAHFFGISPAYFFDDEAVARIDAQLELLAAMRNSNIRQIALRAADLSPESLKNLAVLVEHWRQLEQSATETGTTKTGIERGRS